MAYRVINEQEAFITTFIFILCFTSFSCQTSKPRAESCGAMRCGEEPGCPRSTWGQPPVCPSICCARGSQNCPVPQFPRPAVILGARQVSQASKCRCELRRVCWVVVVQLLSGLGWAERRDQPWLELLLHHFSAGSRTRGLQR